MAALIAMVLPHDSYRGVTPQALDNYKHCKIMKVLHVIDTLGRGGAEQGLTTLLPVLRNHGIESHVAVLGGALDLYLTLEQSGIPVHNLQLFHRWSVVEALMKLTRLVRKERYNIVHGHLLHSSIYTALGGVPPATRRVMTYHSMHYDYEPILNSWHILRKWIHGWLMRNRIDAHIAISEGVAVHCRKHLGLKSIYVIPNSIPIEMTRQAPCPGREQVRKELYVDPDDFLIAVPARLISPKGHTYLLDALSQLQCDRHPVVLLIGDGPCREVISQSIERLGLAAKVRMLGALPHNSVCNIVRSAELVILASTHEGFGRSIIEAMVLETAVLATDIPGIREVVENGVSGLLVPPANPSALAGAMAQLMREPELRHRLARAGRFHAEKNFDVSIVATQWVEFYKEVSNA